MNKIITFALFSILICACTQNRGDDHSQLSDLLDEFQSQPQNLSADLSAKSFEEEIGWLTEEINKYEAYEETNLSKSEQVDLQFALSILRGRFVRQSVHQRWKKDPRVYMRFREIGTVVEGPGAVEDKLDGLKSKLELVPKQLQNAMAQIDVFVPRFQELSLFMAENAMMLFEKQIPEFISTHKGGSEMEALNDAALASLADFRDWLVNALPSLPEGSFATGKEVYNQILSEEFLLDYDDESLWEFGQQQFEKTISELEVLAAEIDSTKSWQELAIEIKNEYPEPHEMIEAHQLWVDSSKAHILNKKLIPIPWNETVKVVPRAEYLRKTSYYGNFSRARGKDEAGVFTAQWMINPFEDRWDEQTKQEYLVEHDWGVIIVTAPHEAYGGHHVQSLYQMHNPSKLRRENGLSLFSEGWGLYNEQLMRETGFFPNKRIELRQLQLRLWRNARVIYDVGLHTGKMGYEEAISLMTDRVGFLRWAAQLEIDAACARPGYFIGYFVGMNEILKMRDDYKRQLGNEFTLSKFHEDLLKIGNMPPNLIRKELLEN